MTRRWTLALSWGPSGGVYVHPRRVCLGRLAVTFVPRVEIDDLMEAYVEAGPWTGRLTEEELATLDWVLSSWITPPVEHVGGLWAQARALRDDVKAARP